MPTAPSAPSPPPKAPLSCTEPDTWGDAYDLARLDEPKDPGRTTDAFCDHTMRCPYHDELLEERIETFRPLFCLAFSERVPLSLRLFIFRHALKCSLRAAFHNLLHR